MNPGDTVTPRLVHLQRRPLVLPRSVRRDAGTGLSRRDLLRGSMTLAAVGALGGCGLANGSEVTAGAAATTAGATPQRIAATYATDADSALVLGLPLVASYSSNGTAFPPYQADQLDGVTPLVTYPEIDLDALTSSEPDLILVGSADQYEPDVMATLGEIAPVHVLAVSGSDVDWRVALLGLAEVVDRVAVAETFIADYDARVVELRERVQARWAGATFAYIGPIGTAQFYVAQPEMATNTVLHDELGLAYSSAVPPSIDERRTDISYEELGMLDDADLLLVRTNPVEGGTEVDMAQVEELSSAPLWSRVPAVVADQVFLIPGDLFYASPLTASGNLDWVEENLLA